MQFELYAWRFVFTAIERVTFPSGKAANTIRGAFGQAAPGEMFSPQSEAGPSGFRTRPRPFVFRTAHLDGAAIEPGSRFHLDIHCFETRRNLLPAVTAALAQWGETGLGAARAKVRLCDVVALHDPPLVIPLAGPAAPAVEVRLSFVTPTELKSGGAVAAEPLFDILFARIRDRVAALSAFYGSGRLDTEVLDALSRRAAAIRLEDAILRRSEVERRSSRTGQRHSIGGMVGTAAYRGDLTDFVPWLRCAEWTGVGRHTGFGNGVIRIDKIT